MTLSYSRMYISFRFMHNAGKGNLIEQEYVISDNILATELLRVLDSGAVFKSDELVNFFAFFGAPAKTKILMVDNFMRLHPVAKLIGEGYRFKIYQTCLLNPAEIPLSQKIQACIGVLVERSTVQ